MPSTPGEGAAATLRMAPVTLLRRHDLAVWPNFFGGSNLTYW